jgi:hypothetical protein
MLRKSSPIGLILILSYVLSVTAACSTASDCSNHGVCDCFGLCVCDVGWTGAACTQPSTCIFRNDPVVNMYSGFILGSWTAPSSDVEGLLAVGGDCTLAVCVTGAPGRGNAFSLGVGAGIVFLDFLALCEENMKGNVTIK